MKLTITMKFNLFEHHSCVKDGLYILIERVDKINSYFVEDRVWWDALTKNVNIEKDDDGTVVAYPALRQTCNPPGF